MRPACNGRPTRPGSWPRWPISGSGRRAVLRSGSSAVSYRAFPAGILGVLFGLGIYGVSYKGWIPALGILPPPEDDRPGRPAVMIAAHIVYGLTLGWLIRPRTD